MTTSPAPPTSATDTCRLLVVDDVAVCRLAIKQVLEDCPEFTVVGSAKDGIEALAAIREQRPDLVTLDLNMPRLDGLGVLKGIAALPRSQRPQVLVFAAPGPTEADLTVQALAAGAADVILKPDASLGTRALTASLVPRLRALTGRRPGAGTASVAQPPRTTLTVSDRETPRRVVLIASSTGGPQALRQALGALPADFPAPVCVVQHIPASFAASLAQHLDEICALPVRTAVDGEPLESGCVVFPPGDHHLALSEQRGAVRVRCERSPRRSGLRPAADVLFTSAAAVYRASCVAAVFTGMGQDGLAGCRDIHAAGGLILTQTTESCVVYGMPRAVDQAELAAGHFTPDDFAGLIRGLRYA